jgi:hypothetical protein
MVWSVSVQMTMARVPIVDLMHWNVSICPENWPIFGRFLTLFPLKRTARREKNTSNTADVRR